VRSTALPLLHPFSQDVDDTMGQVGIMVGGSYATRLCKLYAKYLQSELLSNLRFYYLPIAEFEFLATTMAVSRFFYLNHDATTLQSKVELLSE